MPESMDGIAAGLEQLRSRKLLRGRHIVEGPQGPMLQVEGKAYLAFCSNDYLGLANHPALTAAAREALDRYGVGAGASALISGHTHAVHELEEALAEFVGAPRALHFSTGYMANLGIIPALAGVGDTVYADRLNHACLIDGARLSGARLQVYPHGDMQRLEQLLARRAGGRKLVATDAVFSMDGDIAPLPRLLALCEQYDAWLLVDDAHGFGVLGPEGRGSLAHFGLVSPRIIYMGTLGKAAGVYGAFAAGSAQVIEWLLQKAHTYVFTTAAPPMLAAAVSASLQLIRSEQWRREHLRNLIARLRAGAAELPWCMLPSDTPIQALVLQDNQRALDLAAGLREQGLWVPAIRPPTVPRNTARLRISLSACHTVEQVDRLTGALRTLARRHE